jgi:cytochrome P450
LLTNDQSRRQESIDALYESLAFVAEHIAARREDLGDDFTSAMIRQQLDGKLTEDEVLHEAAALLQASVDNTVHQIGIVFGQLLSERSRWESVLADQELVPQAVEESIRLRPRFNTIFRQADGDVEFRDQVFEDGSWVFVSVRATQRDPRVFPDPAEFRLDRPTHRAMMFGGGPYNCLGQHLARMEFHETLKAVQRRFPAARLVDDWAVHETNAVTEVTHLRAALV